MSTPSLVLTRPAAQNARWVAELRAHQITTYELPLIEIVVPQDLAPLHAAWARLAHCAAVFFVSSNAVAHFFQSKPSDAPVSTSFSAINTRAWVPGPGSAAALIAAGVPPGRIDQPAEDAAQFDSESLWDAVRTQVAPGQRVLIVRGLDARGHLAGRDWMAQQLLQAGARVDQVGAYRRRAPCWQAAQHDVAATALQQRAWWLLSSTEAVANLVRLLPVARRSELAAATAVATHPRVADAARAAKFAVVHTAQPTLAAVLASINSNR